MEELGIIESALVLLRTINNNMIVSLKMKSDSSFIAVARCFNYSIRGENMEDISEKLFVSILSSEKLHPNFKYLAQEKEPCLREVLKEWANGFVDRDKKFVTEFQTTFNSSIWELYL